MPILQAFGPSAGRPPIPPTAQPSGAVRGGAPIRRAPDAVARMEPAGGGCKTAHLYERVKRVVPAVEWPLFALMWGR